MTLYEMKLNTTINKMRHSAQWHSVEMDQCCQYVVMLNVANNPFILNVIMLSVVASIIRVNIISIGWTSLIWLPRENTLAYLSRTSVTKKKCFRIIPPGEGSSQAEKRLQKVGAFLLIFVSAAQI